MFQQEESIAFQGTGSCNLVMFLTGSDSVQSDRKSQKGPIEHYSRDIGAGKVCRKRSLPAKTVVGATSHLPERGIPK